MDQPGVVASSARGHLKKKKWEKMTLFLSSFAPENVVSRDRFGGPVPSQPAAHSPHSRLNMVLTYEIPSIQHNLYVEQTAPTTAAVKSRACVRESCAIHFYGFLGFNRPLLLLLHFVLLTLLLYYLRCTIYSSRFLKKNMNASKLSEHPGGIIGCKD